MRIFLLLLLAATCQQLNAQNWLTTGNSGLNGNNFIGTLENRALIFKTNNREYGRLQNSGSWRFGIGASNASIDSTGKLVFSGTGFYQLAQNSYVFRVENKLNYGLFFNSTNAQYELRDSSAAPVFNVQADSGHLSLKGNLQPFNDNTSSMGVLGKSWKDLFLKGSIFNGTRRVFLVDSGRSNLFVGPVGSASFNAAENTIIGTNAFKFNTTGGSNTALGVGVLNSNLTGGNNVAIGINALFSNTSGFFNVAIGRDALKLNSSGGNNIALGVDALSRNSNGSGNIGLGSQALFLNTSGGGNLAIGDSALGGNLTGFGNIALGAAALGFHNSGNSNVAIGASALHNGSTGDNLIAIGASALFANTTGLSNIAIGTNALLNNTTASNLVAVGDSALFKQSSGSGKNTGVGSKSLFSNITGSNNTALGFEALRLNISSNNTAIGTNALSSNTIGGSNIAIGVNALVSNTIGGSNIAVGNSALLQNISGKNIVAVGDSAQFNLTGGNGFNTAIGSKALFSNITGQENTAAGFRALFNNTGNFNSAFGTNALNTNVSGVSNTGVGTNALIANSQGSNNTAIGVNALNLVTTGSSNTAVGRSANISTGALINSSAFGNSAVADASNKIRLGNTAVTSIGGQVGFTTFSDGRFKRNIKEETHGLDFIKLLKPVSYNYDINGIENFWGVNETNSAIATDKNAPANNRYIGFLAQDVDKIAKSLNYNFSGVDKPADDSKSTWGLRYGDFVVPLVKAVQELSAQNDALKAINDELKTKNDAQDKKIDAILQKLNELQSAQQACCNNIAVAANDDNKQSVILLSGASLDQNIPNPFNNTTTINYTLPQSRQGGTTAQMVITDKTGKTIKSINISGSGKGTLQVDASTLASGAYSYSLYVDGKMLDSKTMILAK